mgnify:CR=1 FL=1
MRQVLRPHGVQDRSAAAPATVTGEVRPWPLFPKGGGKVGGALGKPSIRKPGDLPARWMEPGGRGVPQPTIWYAVACRFVRSPRCAQSDGRVMAATLHVCITCKAGEPVPEGAVAPGALLHAALVAGGVPEGVRIVPVECLSACSQGCSVALSGAGKWSYVYGRLTQADAADVLAGAAAYAATTDGIVPWRERPVIFRKQSLARIPPLEG